MLGSPGRLALAALLVSACEGNEDHSPNRENADAGGLDAAPPPVTIDAGTSDDVGPDVVAVDPRACSDLFDQGVLPTYQIEMSPEDWAALQNDFQAGPSDSPQTYRPCTFRSGTEVVSDARIKLRGQASWVQALANDANPKAQFTVAFDQVDPSRKFHGLKKIAFDMPRGDETMLRERLAWAAMGDLGVPAVCANNARLVINGTYYGLYTAKETMGGRTLKRLFPEAPDGALYKGGDSLEANPEAASTARYDAFWAANDGAAMAAIIDVPATLAEWAAEIVLNDGDGYYCGHNFYTYDHPDLGFIWLADDLDATFIWNPIDTHPLFWWRTHPWRGPRQHWVVVLADDALRRQLVDAVAKLLGRYQPAVMEQRLDGWSAQIATAVAEDPHRPFPIERHKAELARVRLSFAERASYLRSWLDCELGHGGADADGDGLRWCEDCDDGSASVRGIYDGCF